MIHLKTAIPLWYFHVFNSASRKTIKILNVLSAMHLMQRQYLTSLSLSSFFFFFFFFLLNPIPYSVLSTACDLYEIRWSYQLNKLFVWSLLLFEWKHVKTPSLCRYLTAARPQHFPTKTNIRDFSGSNAQRLSPTLQRSPCWSSLTGNAWLLFMRQSRSSQR